MQETLEELWECISTHDNNDDDIYKCLLFLHVLVGIIGIVILCTCTPIWSIFGCWFFLTMILSLILFFIWLNAPEGRLSIGYFFAMHFFSMAWVIVLPIAIVISLLCLPIIISKCVKFKS